MKVNDDNYSLGSSYSSLHPVRIPVTKEVIFKRGYCVTKHGLVGVYQQGYDTETKDDNLLSLTFVFNKRVYYRSIHGKLYTDIGIARKAGEFAKEIYFKK